MGIIAIMLTFTPKKDFLNELLQESRDRVGRYGLINYIRVTELSLPKPQTKTTVTIMVNPEYVQYTRDLFSFLNKMTDVPYVIFTPSEYNENKPADLYVIVGSHKFLYSSFKKVLNRYYLNKKADKFWEFMNKTVLARTQGKVIFINSEFKKIDYGKLIGGNQKAPLKNRRIENKFALINNFNTHIQRDDMNKFIKYVLVQEVFQALTVAADVHSPKFAKKTLLFDPDANEKFNKKFSTTSDGYEYLKRYSSIGLCPTDVVLFMHLRKKTDHFQVDKYALFSIPDVVFYYSKAYYYYWKEEKKEIFDDRCW